MLGGCKKAGRQVEQVDFRLVDGPMHRVVDATVVPGGIEPDV
jgi:hypothetical protein